MFVVTVVFTLHPGQAEIFLALVRDNAVCSRQDEPDCHRFDVCWSRQRPDEVFLYEIYTDAEAFQRHLDTTHFKAFSAQSDHMIAERTITTYELMSQP